MFPMVVVLFFFFLGMPLANGKEGGDEKLSPAKELALCIDKVATYLDIDPLIFLAIYKVESRWNPYAIGVRKGKRPVRSIFPKDKKQAVKIAKKYLSMGYHLDLGIAQINYANIERWAMPLESAFSICKSVKMSAQVLYNCIKTYGKTWRAIDCYNKGFHPRIRSSSSYVRKVKREYYRLSALYRKNLLAGVIARQVR